MSMKSFIRKIKKEREIKTLIINCAKSGEDLMHLYRKPSPANSILIAGSGRSGTTWLADLISGSMKGVQQVFEPIHPMISAEVRELTGFDERDPYVQSLYLRPDGSYPEWANLWKRILTGKFRNYWTDYHKRWSYFPNTYLIKEIRANLMLGYINRTLNPKIIFIIRHPCAVIHSRVKKFHKVWLACAQDILKQEDLVQDHLLPWVADIERETDLIGAHAAWWAIENYVARTQLPDSQCYFVRYEDLAVNPTEELRKILNFLRAKEVSIPEGLIYEPSRLSSDKEKMESDVLKRLASWKNEFDQKTQFKILDWAQKFGITLYDEQALPRSRALLKGSDAGGEDHDSAPVNEVAGPWDKSSRDHVHII